MDLIQHYVPNFRLEVLQIKKKINKILNRIKAF